LIVVKSLISVIGILLMRMTQKGLNRNLQVCIIS